MTVADDCSKTRSATSACLIVRLGSTSSTSRIFRRYCCLSHCARGDQTAGPREVLSRRNWMPTASVTSPMMPPRASTSRTRWPLAMPPMAGLQDICAMRSTFRVIERGLQAHARGGHGGLASGMSGADDDYVELFGELHGCDFPAKEYSDGVVAILATRSVSSRGRAVAPHFGERRGRSHHS